ncbi:MAG: chorismate mutase [SAR202 cluster bacterium]|nr:chorismate mutase [Chloroflexota bacterium]MQG50489.1 chorismate mutase [SAR202 cluster bacterium]|tara:strand:+ start:2828 stop:3208 length:381 start_codon:yes stop_codon:yes gene_type:complete
MSQIACRGIRGATTSDNNDRESIIDATKKLLESIVNENDLNVDDIAAAFFTTTKDLNAEYPAVAARRSLGWTEVALFNTHEMEVPNDISRCIRVLLLVNTNKKQSEINNIYLKDAINLRNRGSDIN